MTVAPPTIVFWQRSNINHYKHGIGVQRCVIQNIDEWRWHSNVQTPFIDILNHAPMVLMFEIVNCGMFELFVHQNCKMAGIHYQQTIPPFPSRLHQTPLNVCQASTARPQCSVCVFHGQQEAQLPQRNSASAAHMEGAKPSSPLPLRPLATPMLMVESETHNKCTSSVQSTKRTLR